LLRPNPVQYQLAMLAMEEVHKLGSRKDLVCVELCFLRGRQLCQSPPGHAGAPVLAKWVDGCFCDSSTPGWRTRAAEWVGLRGTEEKGPECTEEKPGGRGGKAKNRAIDEACKIDCTTAIGETARRPRKTGK
jgi:hypothetical protein